MEVSFALPPWYPFLGTFCILFLAESLCLDVFVVETLDLHDLALTLRLLLAEGVMVVAPCLLAMNVVPMSFPRYFYGRRVVYHTASNAIGFALGVENLLR